MVTGTIAFIFWQLTSPLNSHFTLNTSLESFYLIAPPVTFIIPKNVKLCGEGVWIFQKRATMCERETVSASSDTTLYNTLL